MLFCVSQVESSSVLGEKERFNEIESLFYNIQLQQNGSIETLVCDYFEEKKILIVAAGQCRAFFSLFQELYASF